MTYTTGTSSRTIAYKWGGCSHRHGFTLGCPNHHYEHPVGFECPDCGYHTWWPLTAECESTPPYPREEQP